MNFKCLPFLLILFLAPLKFYEMIVKGRELFDLIIWIAFSMLWCWVAWAFWKNKYMPSYAGKFDYENGENDFARTLYIFATLAGYLLGIIFA